MSPPTPEQRGAIKPANGCRQQQHRPRQQQQPAGSVFVPEITGGARDLINTVAFPFRRQYAAESQCRRYCDPTTLTDHRRQYRSESLVVFSPVRPKNNGVVLFRQKVHRHRRHRR